jgi:hypothetical protein
MPGRQEKSIYPLNAVIEYAHHGFDLAHNEHLCDAIRTVRQFVVLLLQVNYDRAGLPKGSSKRLTVFVYH